MSKKYSAAQVKILLALHKKNLSKSNITKHFCNWKIAPTDREAIIRTLTEDQLIESELRPLPNARKSPTYYALTDQGKKMGKRLFKEAETVIV